MSMPVEDYQAYSVSFSRRLFFVENLVIRGDTVCEFSGFRQIVWFTVRLFATLLVLNFALIANIAVWILREVGYKIVFRRGSPLADRFTRRVFRACSFFHGFIVLLGVASSVRFAIAICRNMIFHNTWSNDRDVLDDLAIYLSAILLLKIRMIGMCLPNIVITFLLA